MNLTPTETTSFFNRLGPLSNLDESLKLCLIPSHMSLERAKEHSLKLSHPITIAAQNASGQKKGAFTGEVSGAMLKDIGIQTVLLGHSERRHLFNESDELIQDRLQGLLDQDFHVLLCVGETEAQRKAGQTHAALEQQLLSALSFSSEQKKNFSARHLTIAYEPVWAIGTGVHAQPEEAGEAHHFIRTLLENLLGLENANQISILYGGSVTPANIKSLLGVSDIDGALVGGASVTPESFLELISISQNLITSSSLN